MLAGFKLLSSPSLGQDQRHSGWTQLKVRDQGEVEGIGLNIESGLDPLPLFGFFSEFKAAAAFQHDATRLTGCLVSGIGQTCCVIPEVRLSCSEMLFFHI